MSNLDNLKKSIKANAPELKKKAIVYVGSTLGLILTSAILGSIHRPVKETVIIVPVDADTGLATPSGPITQEG